MKEVVAALLLITAPAFAATPCDGIWQQPKDQARALLGRTAGVAHPPHATVYDHFRSGRWHIVWFESRDSEPGGAVIREESGVSRLVDIWGGVAPLDERREVEQWGRGKGMPAPLARCFGWYVTAGRERVPPAWPNPFSR